MRRGIDSPSFCLGICRAFFMEIGVQSSIMYLKVADLIEGLELCPVVFTREI